jgi:hypothetical protein
MVRLRGHRGRRQLQPAAVGQLRIIARANQYDDLHTDLVVLYGLPAAGKLTVGRALAALTGYRLCHNHLTADLVESVFRSGTEANLLLRERIWLDVVAFAARYALPGPAFTLVFGRTGPTPGFLGEVERVLTGRVQR